MYMNQDTERGVNKVLKVVFLVVAIGVMAALGKLVVDRLDPDTGGMTVTTVDEEHTSCSDTAVNAMRENGLPIPAKCRKK